MEWGERSRDLKRIEHACELRGLVTNSTNLKSN